MNEFIYFSYHSYLPNLQLRKDAVAKKQVKMIQSTKRWWKESNWRKDWMLPIPIMSLMKISAHLHPKVLQSQNPRQMMLLLIRQLMWRSHWQLWGMTRIFTAILGMHLRPSYFLLRSEELVRGLIHCHIPFLLVLYVPSLLVSVPLEFTCYVNSFIICVNIIFEFIYIIVSKEDTWDNFKDKHGHRFNIDRLTYVTKHRNKHSPLLIMFPQGMSSLPFPWLYTCFWSIPRWLKMTASFKSPSWK